MDEEFDVILFVAGDDDVVEDENTTEAVAAVVDLCGLRL